MSGTVKNFPRDANNAPLITITPSVLAVAVTTVSSLTTSTAITFNTASTLIEVNMVSAGAFMKWGTAATTTVYDEYIQSGRTRWYVIPTGQQNAQFLQQATPATLIVIEK